MNTTTHENHTSPSKGSITVYQRLRDGSKPANVQVLRSVYRSIRGQDGEVYGKTKNIHLLTIASGTPILSARDSATLRSCGLSESQLSHVNNRLAVLAEQAVVHLIAARFFEAEASIKTAVAIASDTPAARTFVLEKLSEAHLVLDDEGVLGPIKSAPPAQNEAPQARLLRALRALNQACSDAQAAYKQLPKGGEPPEDVVLELQKTWFSNQDMFNTLKGRDWFYRPAGWSELRAQVLAGHVFKKGDKVPKTPRVLR